MRHALSELSDSIAIVGMAGRFPGASNIHEFWRNLAGGVESITFFDDADLPGVDPALLRHPQFVKAKGVLDRLEWFDADFFGYTPPEARTMDPQHRLFLECGWTALENAGYNPDIYAGSIGVYAGVSVNTYLLTNLLANPEVAASLGSDKDFLSTRLSYKLNLRGPSIVVQTACSTSLVAVCQACQGLLSYQCDMALAGGVSATVPSHSGYWYQEGSILSPDGHCRAFDAAAKGTVAGNGLGIVVLKRLPDAIEDGDRIRAVIRGFALNNDGAFKIGYTAPGVQGQAQVVAAAQALAGVEPESITYIEAHGTGTELGDPIEIAALTQAFRAATTRKGFCALGSVKSNIGHLDSAAGIAGLIKTTLSLEHRQIPASLHFDQPNPQIDFANSPFFVNTQLREWTPNGSPRRAGVSSFGIGGTNAHVVVEEAPAIDPSGSSRAWQLLTLSARTDSALQSMTIALRQHLKSHPDESIADAAYTLHVGRKKFPHARAIVCRNAQEASAALDTADASAALDGSHAAGDRSVVFMFPGQGSHYTGMAHELYTAEAVYRAHVDECSELFRPHLGLDLREVLQPNAESRHEAQTQLDRTDVTQAALFTVELSLARLWMSWGIRPAALIGHSIGEYVAACVSGVLQLEDAVRLVALRGRLMQAAPSGAMTAIPLSETAVEELLATGLWIAAANGPSSTVVAGETSAIDALEARLRAASIVYQRLRTHGAFHSGLMADVVEPLEAAVAGLRLGSPQIPYVSNLTGTWVTDADVKSPSYWGRHVRETVRFGAGIETLLSWGAGAFVEVGPGQALSGLVRHHSASRSALPAPSVVVPSLARASEDNDDLRNMTRALGAVWAAGVVPDWAAYHAGERRHRVELPTYPFERKRHWAEPSMPKAAVKPIAPAAASASARADFDRWFAIPSWKRTMVPTVQTEVCVRPARVLVLLDGTGSGEAFANVLDRRGHEVIAVYAGAAFRLSTDRSYIMDPAEQSDYEALVASLRTADQLPSIVVHLWGLSEQREDRADDNVARRVQERGFYSLLYLTQAFAANASAEPARFVVVTDGVHDVTGEDEVCPEKATVLGPCRVIQRELPNISCQHIDMAPASVLGPQLIKHLVAELESDVADPVVAYRGIDRWVQTFEPVLTNCQEGAPARLREGGVYLITGGLGAVGLALARYLASAVRARLVLVSRTSLPDRGLWQKHTALHGKDDKVSRAIRAVQSLEEAGAEVLAVRADVSSEIQMREAVAAAGRRFGRIDGVIHAAGVPGGGVMQLRDPAAAAAVMRPKLLGTRVLERILSDESLDFMVLCSSLTGVTGGIGQADYAAANAYLDAFARYQTVRGTFTVAIDWDTWKDGGMAVETHVPRDVASTRTRVLANGLTAEEGVEVFRRCLSASQPQVLIATAGWSPRSVDERVDSSSESAQQATRPEVPLNPRPQLSNAYEPPSDEIQRGICDVWQEALGIERIGVQDSFFDLGGHSLHAIQVMARINAGFGTSIPVARLYEGLTPAFLAMLVTQRGSDEAVVDTPVNDYRQDLRTRQKRLQERRRTARVGQGGGD